MGLIRFLAYTAVAVGVGYCAGVELAEPTRAAVDNAKGIAEKVREDWEKVGVRDDFGRTYDRTREALRELSEVLERITPGKYAEPDADLGAGQESAPHVYEGPDLKPLEDLAKPGFNAGSGNIGSGKMPGPM